MGAAIEANKWLEKASLPLLAPIDSVAQWDFILNGTNGRPGPLHLSENAVLRWPYKLVTGKQPYSVWRGEVYPNCSTVNGSLHDGGPIFTLIEVFNQKIDLAYRTKEQ